MYFMVVFATLFIITVPYNNFQSLTWEDVHWKVSKSN